MPRSAPDARGYFGEFGGRYVPETLMTALGELEGAFAEAREDVRFQDELARTLRDFVGRPTPLYAASRLTGEGQARLLLKREDLAHTGAHKINNAIGQMLLARRMGKRRIVAETGAGQHGVATATAAALFGLDCTVYMGAEDMQRQRPNVDRIKLMGASIVPVEAGTATLREAINGAMRDWVANVETTHYVIGSAVGPHPFPWMVREFQRVIGVEARAQMLEAEGRLPDVVFACVGGGSNAIGIFHPFVDDPGVELIGVEAGGSAREGEPHSATLGRGSVGVLHGARSFVLQDAQGQIDETHSISAGLDYAGVGPEHAALSASGRVRYLSVSDDETLDAFARLCRREGILPALESAHAVAAALAWAREHPGKLGLVNLSGRGDKDLDIVRPLLLDDAGSVS